MIIIPSILTNNPQELLEKIKLLEGVVDRVQIDIVDGQFADNKTITPDFLQEVETSRSIDFHLMTKDPVNWVEKCVLGQADRIVGQIEMMQDQIDFIGKVQEVGCKAGLAIDIETPIDSIKKELINDLDLILVMNYPAGIPGQKFDRRSLKKIEILNSIRKNDATPFKICSDGAVTPQNIEKLAKLGVDEAVVGRSLFNGDLKVNINKYYQIL